MFLRVFVVVVVLDVRDGARLRAPFSSAAEDFGAAR